jgi:hypothetical protein
LFDALRLRHVDSDFSTDRRHAVRLAAYFFPFVIGGAAAAAKAIKIELRIEGASSCRAGRSLYCILERWLLSSALHGSPLEITARPSRDTLKTNSIPKARKSESERR